MKWLVKIHRDEDGEIILREPLYRTDSGHPRGGEFELLNGVLTNYPVVVFTDGAYTVEEGTTAKKLYDQMNLDVMDKVYDVFGTTNESSATAYKETWHDMVSSPANYSSIGLKSRFNRGGFAVDDLLDTDQKVIDYANACLAEVSTYAAWRMQRIQQFRNDVVAL